MNLNQLTGAAVIGQSGGPTAVINATLAGVIKSSLNQENRGRITTLYGMRNGIEGFLEDRLVNLTELFSNDAGEADAEKLDLLMHTPAAALGSCRKKLPDPNENPDFFENMLTLFKARDIRFFFYIGGNDSMDTVDKLSRYVSEHDYPMCVMGLPKTIDNDLPGTDHAPGYGSAAKFIATEMQEIVRDCAVYTVPAVTIVEIMGRDAGWLTASAALPRITGGAAPDLVYLPEKPFSMQSFFNDVRAIMKKKPNVVSLNDAEGETEDDYADLDLHRALMRLPDDDKTIVVLRFFEGLSFQQIAEVLDENINTVKSRLYRSLQKLKQMLEEGGAVSCDVK